MRVLVLSKRRYTNLDLIDDRFGRLRELPLALAAAGHEVAGICLSYRRRDEGRRDDRVGKTRVVWHTLNINRLLPAGKKSYWRTIDLVGREFQPDLIWACSDALHAILAVPLAGQLEAKLVVDLYDNFESFMLTHIPGMTGTFRRALRRADGITCVSHPLAEYILKKSGCRCPVEVVGNAVPEGIFYPQDKVESRRKLGLPTDALLIGTAGAISRSRGIGVLLRAFERFGRERTDAHLVLAGERDKRLSLPQNPRIHALGMLPPAAVPDVLSALDISVICNRPSAFGRYCFPQKFYESIACGVPVVAADVGVLKEMLKDAPAHLYEAGDDESLLQAIRTQSTNPTALPFDVPTWSMRAKRLEAFFSRVLKTDQDQGGG